MCIQFHNLIVLKPPTWGHDGKDGYVLLNSLRVARALGILSRRKPFCCTAGLHVQHIFYKLPEGEGINVYSQIVDALTKYFSPEVNIFYERHVLRSTAQLPSETVEQFITRLIGEAATCEFGTEGTKLEHIRDQVIEKCSSHHLRRKLLEKGRGLTLQQVRDIARSIEISERQASDLELTGGNVNPSQQNEVNKVT